jgi:hypothetical protein
MHRREFIKSAGAAAFIMSLGQKLTFATTPGQIPYRVLGHTGEKVSLLGIGGYHIGQGNGTTFAESLVQRYLIGLRL